MKRLFVMLMALCLILAGCSSTTVETATEAPEGPMTFDEFLEKYKRAEWGVLLSDPVTFYRDFESGLSLPKEEWTQDWSLFEKATYADNAQVCDVVLFNRPFEAHVWDRKTGAIGGMIQYESDNKAEVFAAYTVIFESAIESLGDPTLVRIDWEESSEAKLRKALENMESLSFYQVTWEYDGGCLLLGYNDFIEYSQMQFATN